MQQVSGAKNVGLNEEKITKTVQALFANLKNLKKGNRKLYKFTRF